MSRRGWHRVQAGTYRYTTGTGRVLARVQKFYGMWEISVFLYPPGEAAQEVELREAPHTLREAKIVAQQEYAILIRKAIRGEDISPPLDT